MEKPTVEKCIETKFFKKHSRHMPATLNLKKQKEANAEIAKYLAEKE